MFEFLVFMFFVMLSGVYIIFGDVVIVCIDDGLVGIKSENVWLNGWVYIDILLDLVIGIDLGGYVDSVKCYLLEYFDLFIGYFIMWVG